MWDKIIPESNFYVTEATLLEQFFLNLSQIVNEKN